MKTLEFFVFLPLLFVVGFFVLQSSSSYQEFSSAWRKDSLNVDKTFGPDFFDFSKDSLSLECEKYRAKYVNSLKNTFWTLGLGLVIVIVFVSLNHVFGFR